MRKRSLKIVAGLAACLFVLSACSLEEGGQYLPGVAQPIPDKMAGNAKVKIACYVDLNRYNPLNAGDYRLSNGVQFFDFVILGTAQLKKDAKGVYLHLPDNVRKVLERRSVYLRPLQQKGINVLLGITGGGDGISFGTLNEDESTLFVQAVKDVVDTYALDGLEFYDINGGPFPFYPDEIYVDPDDIADAFYEGGDTVNNLLYYLRKALVPADERFLKTIMLRESNYGRYLPFMVTGSTGEAAFAAAPEQIDFFINPYFDQFVPESAQVEIGTVDPFITHGQYAPMAVDLGGGNGNPTVIPSIDPTDPDGIYQYTNRFKTGAADGSGTCDYGLLYYHNLKAVSEAAAENYLIASDSSKFTQVQYFTISSQSLFQRMVTCTGGNYLKDW
jgi:hypothetical protein